jgi:hypothetical protein
MRVFQELSVWNTKNASRAPETLGEGLTPRLLLGKRTGSGEENQDQDFHWETSGTNGPSFRTHY